MFTNIQTTLLHGLAVSGSSVFDGLGTTKENICCFALKGLYPASVSFSDSSTYANETSRYFSAANVVKPACVFTPSTSEMVSSAVQIFNKVQCRFSVRGGGHSPIPGINGKDHAVLLVTSKLKTLDVKNDVARIGSGNTWAEVYHETDKTNSVVPGGRVGSVGVGGLVLGGGINFQGSEYGLSCDNVINYEVITGDGAIRNANSTHYSDLFWALKGGGNRFGIVTRIDMKVYPLPRVYAGTITYLWSSLQDVLAKVDGFHREGKDPKSSLILNLIDGTDVGAGRFITLVLYYGRPLSSPPKIFQPFYDISGIVSNTVSLKSFSSFVPTDGSGLPVGVFSHTWRTLTYKRSGETNTEIAKVFRDQIAAYRRAERNAINPGIFTLAFEPLSTEILSGSSSTGGNALGLDSKHGPQMLILLTYSWTNKTEEKLRTDALRQSVEKMKAAALSTDKYLDFVYINGAGRDQLPYQSYGKENFQRLRNIRKKYDPEGVFVKLQAGGFPL